eukprot:gb/GFBE01018413.1/.p1 GENE.gb/GFBE01018413.1/~~gb/GFBE01018413.1/.p1  ORF type:complete len:382 (+),score=111.58 gb/GFBE01018413.1/:1-1146(+)
MGKKGGNKISADTPSKAAPPTTSTAFHDNLDEEERRIEAEKQRLRDKKAQESAEKTRKENEWREWKEKEAAKEQRKKQVEERKWEKQAETALQRGKKEGSILEAQDWGDAYWVELSKGVYKQVEGEFFCQWCEKHLNWNTVEGHLASVAHGKKASWMGAEGGASAGYAPSPPPKAPAAAAAGYPSARGKLEEWQELSADGMLRCLACEKVATDEHMLTEDHCRRVAAWVEDAKLKRSGYPSPPESWLAWVNDDWGGRSLKCLLCSKWVTDDTSHSRAGGSKDHVKKMNNLREWEPWLATEKAKYHPPVPKPPPRAPAKAATPAPWGAEAAAPPAPPAKAGPTAAPWAAAPTPAPWAGAGGSSMATVPAPAGCEDDGEDVEV